MKYPSKAANTKPKEKNPDRDPTYRPRYSPRMNSDKNGATIAASAPVPTPATTRAQNKNPHVGAQAENRLARQYNASAYIITFLRPIKSPNIPAENAPIKYPINTELPRTPDCALDN